MTSRRIFELISTAILTIITIYTAIPETTPIKNDIQKFLENYSDFRNLAYLILCLISILTIIFLAYDVYNETKTHSFKYQSRRFFKFFKKWYSQNGTISIICCDLDWIVSEDNNTTIIYDALMKKAKRKNLNIYISKASKKRYEEKLYQEGAKIYKAPITLTSMFSFSCLARMNNNSVVIVRKKAGEVGNSIRFKDINNLYVSELLNSLLTNLEKDPFYEKEQN